MAETFHEPDEFEGEMAAMPYRPDDAITQPPIFAVHDRNERWLLGIDGVRGVGIGRNPIGDDALVVYIRDAAVAALVPVTIEEYPVELVVTGEIDAL